MSAQKGVISPLVIIIIVFVLGVGGYFVFGKNLTNQSSITDNQKTNQLKTYQDDKRGFSVSYPQDWIVNEIMGSSPKDPGNPNEKSVEFRPQGERYIPLFIVSKIKKSDKWNLQDFKKEMAKSGDELKQKESDLTIKGVTGWNYTTVTKNFGSKDYFQLNMTLLSKDNQTYYEIDVWDGETYPNKKVLEEMLNSFKIL